MVWWNEPVPPGVELEHPGLQENKIILFGLLALFELSVRSPALPRRLVRDKRWPSGYEEQKIDGPDAEGQPQGDGDSNGAVSDLAA